MTDIEKRVRGLVAKHDGSWAALFAELEAHDATKAEFEAFRRDVSDMLLVMGFQRGDGRIVGRFILPEPVDPLVEALNEATGYSDTSKADANRLREALAKRGLTITEQNP